ncbi:MAG: TolC family protein [Bdellovibrionales bacterium]|nr:TolC family protein [Bdellovibrionales bacterium]
MAILIATQSADFARAGVSVSEQEYSSLMACSALRAANLGSSSIIEIEYLGDVAKSEKDVLGVLNLTQRATDFDSTSRTSAFTAEVTVSKVFFDLSLDGRVGAYYQERQMKNWLIQELIFKHLLQLNSILFEWKGLGSQIEITSEQVDRLKSLKEIAGTLSSHKVIDYSDQLLLGDGYQKSVAMRLDLERKRTLSADQIIQLTGENVISIETNPASRNLDLKSWIKSDSSKWMFPSMSAIRAGIESVEANIFAYNRSWWPKLQAEVGITQIISADPRPVDSGMSPYAGVALTMNWPESGVDATIRRNLKLATLYRRQLDEEQKSLRIRLNRQVEILDLLKSRVDLGVARVKELSRLFELQSIKFKSGKLSYFQLKDSESTLYDAKRDLVASELELAKLKIDLQIYRAFSKGDGLRELGWKCKTLDGEGTLRQ